MYKLDVIQYQVCSWICRVCLAKNFMKLFFSDPETTGITCIMGVECTDYGCAPPGGNEKHVGSRFIRVVAVFLRPAGYSSCIVINNLPGDNVDSKRVLENARPGITIQVVKNKVDPRTGCIDHNLTMNFDYFTGHFIARSDPFNSVTPSNKSDRLNIVACLSPSLYRRGNQSQCKSFSIVNLCIVPESCPGDVLM